MNQLPPVGSHQTDPFTSQDVGGAETRNEMNARAIYDLQQEVTEQAKRIEKLEAALETWLIAVNYDDAATPPMNEMVIAPTPE